MKMLVPLAVAVVGLSVTAHAATAKGANTPNRSQRLAGTVQRKDAPKPTPEFQRQQLSDEFWSEGASYGDFNKDGHNDIVAGPYWYAGPDFMKRHEYAPATQTHKHKPENGEELVRHGYDPLGYSKNFFAFTYDINRDGWTDILILGFPGEESSWYANPGKKDATGHWTKHVAIKVTDNESPTFGDITGDGLPEIICNSEGYFGYAQPDWNNPTKLWRFNRVTPKGGWQRFTHGLGYGDINGDGRMDILEKDGWWEQPRSETPQVQKIWKRHPFGFASQRGSSQMYAYDVDADGDNDVITALDAHGYGLAWYEHVKEGNEITFKKHIIIDDEASDSPHGVKFSQLHAVELTDMNGDGLKDIVTGKRWWAHGPKGDAEPNADAVLYWFELSRKDGVIDWIPHQVDNASGIGTQVVTGHVNKDKLPDIVVGNKKGAFVFLQGARKPAAKPVKAKAESK